MSQKGKSGKGKVPTKSSGNNSSSSRTHLRPGNIKKHDTKK